MTSSQSAGPQSPNHSTKWKCLVGTGLRVTFVPPRNLAFMDVQKVEHEMPAGELFTVPRPPALETVRAGVATNVAATDLLPELTVQRDPLTPPAPHPAQPLKV